MARMRPLAVFSFAVWAALAQSASAICPTGCQPTQKPNWPQTQSIAFGSVFSTGDNSAIMQGLDYWNTYFANNGMTQPLQYSPPPNPRGWDR